MKLKNCVKGQRVIVKKNATGASKGSKGILLETEPDPYVKMFDDYGVGCLHVEGNYYSKVASISSHKLKKDPDYPELEDIKKYAM